MAFSNERELGDEIRQTKSSIDQSKLAVQKMAKIEELERAEEEQKKRLKMYQDEKKVLERDYETAKREATKLSGQYFFFLQILQNLYRPLKQDKWRTEQSPWRRTFCQIGTRRQKPRFGSWETRERTSRKIIKRCQCARFDPTFARDKNGKRDAIF